MLHPTIRPQCAFLVKRQACITRPRPPCLSTQTASLGKALVLDLDQNLAWMEMPVMRQTRDT